MSTPRTDLALEAAESLGIGTKKLPHLAGLHKSSTEYEGYEITTLHVTDPAAAQSLGKPQGTYITMDLHPYYTRQTGFFTRAAQCLAHQLSSLLPPTGPDCSVLVVGLGNRSMTPDAIGPLCLESLLVTRHMVRTLPEQFRSFTPVSALATGVLSETGMESQELIHAIVGDTAPSVVIAVDALAARNRNRLCTTIQLSDTGLVPGSGVGNHRLALSRETIGIPVLAIGIPTVIDAATLASDLLSDAGHPDFDFGHLGENLFVTPRDIDSRVREMSRLLGYGISLALQPSLTLDDITGLLG